VPASPLGAGAWVFFYAQNLKKSPPPALFVYSFCMGIEYSTTPENYEQLVESIRGQVERTRELRMMGESISYEESVVLTSESFLSMLDRIESLSELATYQAHLFVQIEGLFRWVFSQLGVDMDALANENEQG